MDRQRVYIASAAGNAAAAFSLAERVERMGHAIVSTWHDDLTVADRRESESLLPQHTQRAIAARCLDEVRQATWMVVLSHVDMRGALVEIGVATERGIPVQWASPTGITLFASLGTSDLLAEVQ
jgi:nucleoside 2-deoxyribosyltransferase